MGSTSLRGGTRILGCVVVSIGLAACSDDRVLMPGVEGTGSSDAATSTTSASTTSASTTSPSSMSGSTTALADDTSVDSTGLGFVPPRDAGGESFECNLLTQDCPPGQKCMAWANDGGNAWNATRCTPIAEDPVPVDGPCHVVDAATTGIDDCELGALCYDVDPETLEGTCVPMCVGNEEVELYCEDPDRYCYLSGDGALIPCLELCDGATQDCPAGDACYAVGDAWTCMPDASGDSGAYGDPCEFINVCDPGLICVDPSVVPPGLPCEATSGCCTETCDLTDPAGDQQCAGAAGGQQCVPWYADGEAPVVIEHVGVCVVP